MKNIFKIIKIFRLFLKSPYLVATLDAAVQLMDATKDSKKPMGVKIALIDTKNGKCQHIYDFISLWAGIGDANPIERIRHLRAQNEEMKRLLKISVEAELSAADKTDIEYVLKCFE